MKKPKTGFLFVVPPPEKEAPVYAAPPVVADYKLNVVETLDGGGEDLSVEPGGGNMFWITAIRSDGSTRAILVTRKQLELALRRIPPVLA